MVFKLFWDWHLSPSYDRRGSTHRSSYVSSGRREYEQALRKYGRLDVYSYGDFRIWAIPQPTPQVYSVRQDRHGHIVKIHDRDSRRSVKRSREDRTSRVGVQHGRGRGDWLPDYDSSSSSSSSYGSFGSCDPPSRQSSSRESDVILHTEYASSSSDSTLDGDPRDGRHKRSDWDDAHHGGRSTGRRGHMSSRRRPDERNTRRRSSDIVDWPRRSEDGIRYGPGGGTWRDV